MAEVSTSIFFKCDDDNRPTAGIALAVRVNQKIINIDAKERFA